MCCGHQAIWIGSLHREYPDTEHRWGLAGLSTSVLFALEQHGLLYPAAGVCLIFHRCFTGVCVCVVCLGVYALLGKRWLMPQAKRGKKLFLILSRVGTMCVWGCLCVFLSGQRFRFSPLMQGRGSKSASAIVTGLCYSDCCDCMCVSEKGRGRGCAILQVSMPSIMM